MVQSGSTRGRRGSRPYRRITFPAILLLVMIASCVPPAARTGGDSGAGGGDSLMSVQLRAGRIHGTGSSLSPPILRVAPPGTFDPPQGFGAASLTIQADLIADAPPTLSLELTHCDQNWVPTRSVFIQDQAKLRAGDVQIYVPPYGADGYDYSATVTFPSETNNVEIRYSGNYLARLVDAFNPDNIVAEFRFFAVEPTAGVELEMISDFFESAWTEKVQEGLRARVEVMPPTDLFSSGFQAIHLIESGKWSQPFIASEFESREPRDRGEVRSTWSDGYGGKVIAEFRNIPSGNEHRILDLTDRMNFPPGDGVYSTRLSDQPRFANFSEHDNDGMARYDFVPPEDQDYVYFEFRLDIEGERIYDDMAVVGTFNNWTPTWDWRLVYDPDSRRYLARGWISRAVHEYEYVSGKWNVDTGLLERAEATLLEGNSVYASQTWYALAYYRNQTANAYDRIVGVGIDVSGGR